MCVVKPWKQGHPLAVYGLGVGSRQSLYFFGATHGQNFLS